MLASLANFQPFFKRFYVRTTDSSTALFISAFFWRKKAKLMRIPTSPRQQNDSYKPPHGRRRKHFYCKIKWYDRFPGNDCLKTHTHTNTRTLSLSRSITAVCGDRPQSDAACVQWNPPIPSFYKSTLSLWNKFREKKEWFRLYTIIISNLYPTRVANPPARLWGRGRSVSMTQSKLKEEISDVLLCEKMGKWVNMGESPSEKKYSHNISQNKAGTYFHETYTELLKCIAFTHSEALLW